MGGLQRPRANDMTGGRRRSAKVPDDCRRRSQRHRPFPRRPGGARCRDLRHPARSRIHVGEWRRRDGVHSATARRTTCWLVSRADSAWPARVAAAWLLRKRLPAAFVPIDGHHHSRGRIPRPPWTSSEQPGIRGRNIPGTPQGVDQGIRDGCPMPASLLRRLVSDSKTMQACRVIDVPGPAPGAPPTLRDRSLEKLLP
jgi:hypothetical protein